MQRCAPPFGRRDTPNLLEPSRSCDARRLRPQHGSLLNVARESRARTHGARQPARAASSAGVFNRERSESGSGLQAVVAPTVVIRLDLARPSSASRTRVASVFKPLRHPQSSHVSTLQGRRARAGREWRQSSSHCGTHSRHTSRPCKAVEREPDESGVSLPVYRAPVVRTRRECARSTNPSSTDLHTASAFPENGRMQRHMGPPPCIAK